jgi:hypothetical protein
MPDQEGHSQFTEQAKQYEESLTRWQDVSIQAELGDKQVTVTQKISVACNEYGYVDILRVPDIGCFIWRGEFSKGEKPEMLEQGNLVVGLDAYMPLETAFDPSNAWIWEVGWT